jgi:hypothetical protein
VQLHILQVPPETAGGGVGYRGIDRRHPYPLDDSDRSAPATRLFYWYGEHTNWFRSALSEHDLPGARELVREFARLGIRLELVEVAPSPDKLQLGRFIGYDAGGYDAATGEIGESVLDTVLGGMSLPHAPFREAFEDDPVEPLVQLIRKYFNPKRNAYGLMDDPEPLAFLRSVLGALLRGFPNCIEPEAALAKVVAIGLIDE